MSCHVMLCYIMSCHVMLCNVMSCYVMLCYVMLYYVILCYIACYAAVHHITKMHDREKPFFCSHLVDRDVQGCEVVQGVDGDRSSGRESALHLYNHESNGRHDRHG